MAGWIKLYRKMLENPVVNKDPEHLAVWIYLLLHASHKRQKAMFGGRRITLEPGQLITGRRQIGRATNCDEHKVDRVLKALKSAQQIEQQAERYGSLITVLNWGKYQKSEPPNEQQMSHKRATDEPPMSHKVSTIQEYKEYKEGGEAGGPRKRKGRLDWIDEL